MRLMAGLRLRSSQSPQMTDEAVDVVLVLIDSESDPQHVAADVGDAIAREQIRIPALRTGIAKGEEAGMRAAVERIEQIGVRNAGFGD